MNGIVYLITSDRLGSGDAELGALLMGSLIKTLAGSEPVPATLLLMNGGVRLAVEGSSVVEALRELEQRGTSIASCGTCLDYYRLKEDLRVGKVGNMADTVALLGGADRVICL